MKITKKCPNCYQEVHADSIFCVHCGTRIEGGAAAEAAVPVTMAAPAAAYAGPRFCPQGHRVENPALGFCEICGMTLVDEEVQLAPEKEATATLAGTIRTCVNGHTTDDPEQRFCVICGKPMTETAGTQEEAEAEVTEEKRILESRRIIRTCRNGHSYDDPGLVFCPECGLRYDDDMMGGVINRMECIEVVPSVRKDEPVARKETAARTQGIPAGLRVLTVEDLRRK